MRISKSKVALLSTVVTVIGMLAVAIFVDRTTAGNMLEDMVQ